MKKNAFALLPISNRATECFPDFHCDRVLVQETSANRELLNVASRAVIEYRVERNVAYDPFDNFWGNPDEPKHSWLLWYFINPHANHGCGLFLLRRFLNALNISDVELLVDGNCEVMRERLRIDLLITRNAADSKYAIIIENKVNGAIDQKEQLQTYYRVVQQMGYRDEQVFVCYLTLRGGSPSADSVGNIKARLIERSFKEHVVPWLESVLRDRGEWPVKMLQGMSENLKHYLDLIKWRLNTEKIMQMNETIFAALKKADSENRLPTLAEIAAVKESAQVLDECYRRFKRAKMISAVQRLLLERDKLQQTDAFHDKWFETGIWFDDFSSNEYWFGFSVGGIVIVALGEDQEGGIYTGYCKVPTAKEEEVKKFDEFVRQQDSKVFTGKSNPYWFSFDYYPEIDGTLPEHIVLFADSLVQMFRNMNRLVTGFKKQ